jgi:hypothetical protein
MGGGTSVNCAEKCLIEDSWLHGQYLTPGTDQHLGGFLSNGGNGDIIVRHNTIHCEPRDNVQGGGCSGDGQIYGDFGPLKNITFDGNLFLATPGGYCASFGNNPGKPYGSNSTYIVVTGNVFGRGSDRTCGAFGPVTAFRRNGEGNVWSGNVWEDGPAVNP